jgi:hypothetical protein
MSVITKISLHKEFDIQLVDTKLTGDYFYDEALKNLKAAYIIGSDLKLGDMPQANERYTAEDGITYIVVGNPNKLIPPGPPGYSIRLIDATVSPSIIKQLGYEVVYS